MKAITIKQPWASLIVDGLKDIENRTWKTKFRGRVLIHASMKPMKPFKFTQEQTIEMMNHKAFGIEHEHPNSCIIGSVEIVDCVINHPSIWAEKTKIPYLEDVVLDVKHLSKITKPNNIIYNWVLANPIKFDKPIYNVKGKLSFWDY